MSFYYICQLFLVKSKGRALSAIRTAPILKM
jgi:hypothetical protein